MTANLMKGKASDGKQFSIHVDASGNLIIASETVLSEVETVTTVTEIAHITSVDSVDKSVNYLTNINGVTLPARGSITGYTLVKDVQSSIQYSDEIEYVFDNSSPQFTGHADIFPLPNGDIASKHFITVYNPSNITGLNMYVMNEVIIGGDIKYGALYDKSNTAATIIVPASLEVLFNATAWSSCFTSINNVLSDESGDINDASPANDVPFTFGAVDDAIYFGAPTPFDRIRVNVGTAGVYNAIFTWEYWNGSAWVVLTDIHDTTNTTLHDGTQPFKRVGIRSVGFYQPHDWVPYDISGDPGSAYWIRARVTTFISMTTGPALNQGWYKRVGQPDVHNFLLEGIYGGGECKITLENTVALGATDGFSAWVRIKRL